MPSTEYQGASSPLASLGRSILSIRRDQVHSMDSHHDGGAGEDQQLESFQRHVAEMFHGLAGGGGGGGGEDLLSLSWVRKLLEAFLVRQEEFRGIVLGNRAMVSRPPLDRLVGEFVERGVKALDVCNAVRDGIEQVRQWRKHLEMQD